MTPYESEAMALWSTPGEDPFTLRFAKQFTQRTSHLLHFASKFTRRLQPKLADRLTNIAREAILTVLDQASTARQFDHVERSLRELGSHASTTSEIRMLPLEIKDETALRLAKSTRIVMSAQGATAGILTSVFTMIPGLQGFIAPTIAADLYVTIRLMAQGAVQTGYSYGYSLRNAEDLPHLLIAMSPFSADQELISAKVGAHLALRQASFTLTKAAGEHLSSRLIATSIPAVGQLIDLMAARLAMRLLEQQGSLILPIAGAAVQGSVNAAFAHASYLEARRYFQRLHLVDRYGEDFIKEREERNQPLSSQSNPSWRKPIIEQTG